MLLKGCIQRYLFRTVLTLNVLYDIRGLDNQGLRGFLPDDISKLSHLQNM